LMMVGWEELSIKLASNQKHNAINNIFEA
jgi:hypothetical protein